MRLCVFNLEPGDWDYVETGVGFAAKRDQIAPVEVLERWMALYCPISAAIIAIAQFTACVPPKHPDGPFEYAFYQVQTLEEPVHVKPADDFTPVNGERLAVLRLAWTRAKNLARGEA
jgi:hypothetical protein